MSDTITKTLLSAYEQNREPTKFLSGMFKSPQFNFYNTEEIEIDIVRSEEDIAIAVQDLSVGARLNSEDIYTNKGFKPPIFREAGAINAHTLMKRLPGNDPFVQNDFRASAIERGFRIGMKLQSKIARAVEHQASQVLTTGQLTLIDNAGNSVYALDFKPKSTHFPTTSNAWTSAGATIAADIVALANVIRNDGGNNPDMLIMGEGSYEAFIQDADITSRMNRLNMNGTSIVPLSLLGNGGIFRGVAEIGNYRYDIYTYSGTYKHPQTGVVTSFVPNDKVIIRASSGRLDATFGAIPRIGTPDPRVPSALTSRVSSPAAGMDMNMWGYITQDGTSMMIEAGARPLLIPTAIDTYGCLDTGI